MKTEKKLFHSFDASAFDEELGLLNEMSEKGWQLSAMGLITQKYVWDDSAVYRYAIDHQDELSAGEFKQYRAEFEDQGWAYVTKNGGWYVFRRLYDPALPEDEYLIYSDEPSFRDMKRTVSDGVNILGLAGLPGCLVTPSVSFLPLVLAMLYTIADSVRRQRRLKMVRRVPKPYQFHLWRCSTWLVLLLLLAGVAYQAVSDFARPEMTPIRDRPSMEPVFGVQSVEFTIEVTDIYGIYALAVGSDEPTVPYWVTDAEGKLVFSGEMTARYNVPKDRFFRSGDYTLSVDWSGTAGGRGVYVSDPGPLVRGVPEWVFIVWYTFWPAIYIALGVINKKRRRRR